MAAAFFIANLATEKLQGSLYVNFILTSMGECLPHRVLYGSHAHTESTITTGCWQHVSCGLALSKVTGGCIAVECSEMRCCCSQSRSPVNAAHCDRLCAACAAGELPATVIGAVAVDSIGRRPTIGTGLLLTGVACCVCSLLNPGFWSTALAALGKSTCSSAWSLAYIYAAELMPTSVRSAALAGSNQAAR